MVYAGVFGQRGGIAGVDKTGGGGAVGERANPHFVDGQEGAPLFGDEDREGEWTAKMLQTFQSRRPVGEGYALDHAGDLSEFHGRVAGPAGTSFITDKHVADTGRRALFAGKAGGAAYGCPGFDKPVNSGLVPIARGGEQGLQDRAFRAGGKSIEETADIRHGAYNKSLYNQSIIFPIGVGCKLVSVIIQELLNKPSFLA